MLRRPELHLHEEGYAMRAAIILLLCLVLAGCLGILGPEARGSFEADVSGAVTATLRGQASAGYTGGSATSRYLIDLMVSDGRGVYIQFPERPGKGSYAVEPYGGGTQAGPRASFLSEPNGGGFLGTAGTIVITGSGGTFEFTASDTPGTVQVRGSFSLD
jgi:hypothetical protein